MWHKMVCLLLMVIVVIVFSACGDSDDEDLSQPTSTTSPATTQTTTPAEIDNIAQRDVDFGAEQAAVREVFEAHNAALRGGQKEIDDVMSHWLKSENKEVFMAQDVAGALNIIEGWRSISDSWDATRKRIGSVPIPLTIGEIGIDKKAKNATIRGGYSWIGGTKYIAAFLKDKQVWKVRAIDFGLKSGLIKQIITPQ